MVSILKDAVEFIDDHRHIKGREPQRKAADGSGLVGLDMFFFAAKDLGDVFFGNKETTVGFICWILTIFFGVFNQQK